ncbi:MAG: VWA domain-containing protein [Pyrinomonadaceae bacterium]|nr:VWA domain-containing protein [Pyrinomonadaceae bacterium]
MEFRIKRSTAIILTVLFAFALAPAQSDDDEPLKIETLLLNVPVFVSDKDGRRIPGLKKEDFKIFQKGEEQTIEFFADAEDDLNVVLIVDASISVTKVIYNIKRTARTFFEILRENDAGMILSFNRSIDLVSPLTTNKNLLIKNLSGINVDEVGGSNMNDAVFRAISKDLTGVNGRKAIIILTDGFVEGRKVSNQHLIEALVESDTVVYPIVFQSNPIPGIPRDKKTMTMNELLQIPPFDFLNEIALATGGRVYAADGSNFDTAFKNIADELKKQYVIGFYPTNPEGGKEAPIKITVNRPGAIARAKRAIRLKVPDTNKMEKQSEDRSKKVSVKPK